MLDLLRFLNGSVLVLSSVGVSLHDRYHTSSQPGSQSHLLVRPRDYWNVSNDHGSSRSADRSADASIRPSVVITYSRRQLLNLRTSTRSRHRQRFVRPTTMSSTLASSSRQSWWLEGTRAIVAAKHFGSHSPANYSQSVFFGKRT